MLVNLRALFGVIVDIILLRRGPENLPASSTLLAIIVALYVPLYSIAYIVFIVPQVPQESYSWVLKILLAALLQLLWFRAAFQLAGKPERFVQTMCAIFAVNTFFIPSLALIGAMIPYVDKKAAEAAPAMLVLPAAFITVWVLVVWIRIVKSAFEWSWPASIFFALAANFVPGIILAIIFGDSPKPA